MHWRIKKIYNFTEKKNWKEGYTQFGFHDYKGNNFVLQNENHWLGQLTKKDEFLWTAGSYDPKVSNTHILFELKNPVYLSRSPNDESLCISSSGNKKIFKLFLEEEKVELFVDAEKNGLKDIGNCVCDKEGNVWVNEITGYRIWQFDLNGKKKIVLGNGKEGFQKKVVKFDKVQFNWIYDIRLGPDDDLYVLDGKNYTLRRVNIDDNTVELIAGTGSPGYSGDGDIALKATFGSNLNEKFDGPWSLSLDEKGNIMIGDTQNHVVRAIDKKTGIIETIAGKKDCIPSKRNAIDETNPLKLNLPKICSMDYFNNELFIPEWDGDLIILERIN